MSTVKKITIFLVIVFLLIAFSTNGAAISPEKSTSKEEVVYATLNNNGGVSGIYVVNIFDTPGTVLDYGDYSTVNNMTSTEQIIQNGDKITVENNKNKLYYEGDLKNKDIPWIISIKYYLNGQEINPEDIVGKNGKFQLKLSVDQNKTVNRNFFDSYALQSTIKLDTTLCKNIVSEDASVANVGSDKQYTYTIFPGKDADITINADVENFRMDPITFSGIRLAMNIQVDDEKLLDEARELMNGVSTLDNGTQSFAEGTGKLKEGIYSSGKGTANLNYGMENLYSGITQIQKALDELNDNSSKLTHGSNEITNGLKTVQNSVNHISLNTQDLTMMVHASAQIKNSIDQLAAGMTTLNSSINYNSYKSILGKQGLDLDSLKSQNATTISSVNKQITELKNILASLPPNDDPTIIARKQQINEQIDQLQGIVKLLGANAGAITGTEQYLNEVSLSADTLNEGINELQKNYQDYNNSIKDLVNKLNALAEGVTELSAGVDTLVGEYENLNTGIGDYTQGVASIIAGYDSIYKGSYSLCQGSSDLNMGITSMYNGAETLNQGALDLKNGTSEMRDKTSNMDTQIRHKIDDAIKSLTGSNNEVISFVSDKNTDVKSVQFVIKTKGVNPEELKKDDNTVSEDIPWWQKLLNLFKF